ncbi:hypothetical protein ElyMa_004242300 [Elysia marginata]|uniref:Uncharacterized protein n=1 Tax=Elysia marginata TaxID=1093978 RepID=A0AAV4GS55_9GAST|nr:hypothetical protein ElyMa_004242300 [Elysia marginata]
MMNSFLQMSASAGQMPAAFGHHAHNTHFSSSGSGGGIGGVSSSSGNLNSQQVYHHPHHHHHHHPHPAHHPHLGQLYHPGQHPHFNQTRPSFAIQEILGLSCGRQGASTPPSPGSVPDTATATAAAAAAAAAALMVSGGGVGGGTGVSSDSGAAATSASSSSSSMPGLGPGGVYFNPGAGTPPTTSQTLCGTAGSLAHHHHHHSHPHPHHQNMQAGASGFPTPPIGSHHHHHHHGPHQSMGAGSLYPWRLDLGPNVGPGQALSAPRFPAIPGRHSEDIVFDYKHSIGDDGEYRSQSSFHHAHLLISITALRYESLCTK